MSELSVEEKEAINNLRFYSTNVGFSKYDGTACLLRARDVQILLNLLGKQQKELNNLKEIEQSHKEENGKLRKEIKELEEIKADYGSKNEIREKIEETNSEKLNYSEDEYYLENEVKGYAIDKLKELLKGK